MSDVAAILSPMLSPRETAVLCGLARGHTNRRVAAELRVRPKTVESFRRKIGRKLDTTSLADWTRYAIHRGWVSPSEGF